MKTQDKNIRVIISGGGTGGHIFPAIAIANAIKEMQPDAEILFVGAMGKMEMEKVPQAGYNIKGLWISGIKRSLSLSNLTFPLKLWASMRKAAAIIKDFKPDVVVGVGGFASGPTLKAANNKKIPSLIQEQNSYPGITNRLLAKKAAKICVAYDHLEQYFPKEKIVYTGNPIRKEVVNIKGKSTEAYDFFGLEAHRQTLLIVGGSLGALAVNEAVKNHMKELENNNIQIIWQTGKLYYEQAVKAVEAQQLKLIRVVEFIQRMDLAYAAADLVISRAGAIAISELCATAKPSIFVPLPTAAEDHQTKNAQALLDKNAALLIPNNEINTKITETVLELMGNNIQRQQLSDNIAPLGILDADERIAQEVMSLALNPQQKKPKK